ncbi:MAG TPA: methyltransferase domain-containing protein, partial [Rhodanobacter sp.]|nr:methyltransferase domain-containing protein [Rhodanobacter sp.]
MSSFHLDRTRLRHQFGRAAKTYEDHDALQRATEDLLLDRLDYYEQTPEQVLDIGAGTGRGTALLKERYPKAEVIALDLAVPMLREAKKHSGWLKPLRRVCGEATALPFPDHSMDIVHSNLCFQWVDQLDAVFAEACRVLKPGGMLAFTSFGPDTLKELRAAWASADAEGSHVGRFLDMHDVGVRCAQAAQVVEQLARRAVGHRHRGHLQHRLAQAGVDHRVADVVHVEEAADVGMAV